MCFCSIFLPVRALKIQHSLCSLCTLGFLSKICMFGISELEINIFMIFYCCAHIFQQPLLRHFIIIFILYNSIWTVLCVSQNKCFFYAYIVNDTQAHQIVKNIFEFFCVFFFSFCFRFLCRSIWHICLIFSFTCSIHIWRRIRNEHPKMNGWTFCRIQSFHPMEIVFYCWQAFKRLVRNISLISNM